MGSVVRRVAMLLGLVASVLAPLAGVPGAAASGAGVPSIAAVGAEVQYANVISQVGGKWVQVTAIESNPTTDPHTFEASPSVAKAVSGARVVVQNGLGYDGYMSNIESASSSSSRRVIDVQKLLGLPASTPNPHLWYMPRAMPAVARALVGALSAIEPSHAAAFRANAANFDGSLKLWYRALKTFAERYPRTPVATTEPVGDYMLSAAGAVNLTPFSFQADVMNGVDPAPQAVALENSLFSQHRVKVFLYNRQVTSSLTESFLSAAKKYGIPVVGMYETMPAGYSYQQWMLAEVTALQRAVADRVSTQTL